MLGPSNPKIKKKKKVRETRNLCTMWVGGNSGCDVQTGSRAGPGPVPPPASGWGLVRTVARRTSRRSFASAASGDSPRAEVKPRSAARLPRAPPSPFTPSPRRSPKGNRRGATRRDKGGGVRPQREKLRRPRVAAAGY